jgi:hypothetical protein
MPYDAFISYSSHDKATADATCAALEAAGIRCWIAPRDIVPGAEWGEAIILGINQCRVLILIFSAHANDSPQIRREIERAVSKGLPIIPFRIEDIVPTRSLEYFIRTVHWLDALTPPLEAHLRRLAETVKTLLQINPTPPRIVTAPSAASTTTTPLPSRRMPALIAGVCLVSAVAVVGAWRFVVTPGPQPASPSPPAQPQSVSIPQPAQTQPVSTLQPAPPAVQAGIDPLMLGTFVRDRVIDDYDWHFVYSIAPDGTYRLLSTQEEYGTFQAGRGQYRTVGGKTGRVRTGTYRAVGTSTIEITNTGGTFLFQPTQPIAPLDPANPIMLGVWRASTVQAGVPWTLTIQNNLDGTYRYEARAEDTGTCTIANQQWRTTSATTGQSKTGTYRVVDDGSVEITGPDGPGLWRR